MASTLPMDIVLHVILPKLPAKSLLRFKCVSKYFLAKISSPKFNALFSDANRFLIIPGRYKTFAMYELESPHSPPTVLRYPKVTDFYEIYHMSIVACFESYLLIGCGFTNRDNLVLLNPTTRIYRKLPKIEGLGYDYYNHILYGMCRLDEFDDDFNVVIFFEYSECYSDREMREIQVYRLSLRTNSWRLVDCKTINNEMFLGLWGYTPVLVENHLFHVFIEYETDTTRIGCFDIKAQRWSYVAFPDILSGENIFNAWNQPFLLSELDGQLCISYCNFKKSTYDSWVMKHYGEKESWTKLMSISVNLENNSLWQQVYHPIAYSKGSPHDLLCTRAKGDGKCELCWYNLRDKIATTEFYGYSGFAHICKGSLLNFPGGQPIEASSEEHENEDVYDDGDFYYEYDVEDDVNYISCMESTDNDNKFV